MRNIKRILSDSNPRNEAIIHKRTRTQNTRNQEWKKLKSILINPSSVAPVRETPDIQSTPLDPSAISGGQLPFPPIFTDDPRVTFVSCIRGKFRKKFEKNEAEIEHLEKGSLTEHKR